MSNSFVRRIHMVLHAALKQAVKERIILSEQIRGHLREAEKYGVLPMFFLELLIQEHEQHPNNPILFPLPRAGSYWSPGAVSRINRKLLAKADIEEHVRFHDLRHTFATMVISSGADVKALTSMLGHFSAGFTPEPPDPLEESRCKVIPFEKVG